MLHHHLPEIRTILTSNSFFDSTMYLVLLQRYEETYLAAGGFRKVAPEELHDSGDDGDGNNDDDDIYILAMCLSRKIITSANCTKTMFEICSEIFQQLFDK